MRRATRPKPRFTTMRHPTIGRCFKSNEAINAQVWSGRGEACSEGASLRHYGECCLPHDEEVQREGPILDVAKVESDRLLPAQE